MFCNANLLHCQRTKYFKISVYSSSDEGWRVKLSISMLKSFSLLIKYKISVFDAPGAFVMLFWMLLKFFFSLWIRTTTQVIIAYSTDGESLRRVVKFKCKFIWHSKVVSTTSQFTYRRDLKNVCTTRCWREEKLIFQHSTKKVLFKFLRKT